MTFVPPTHHHALTPEGKLYWCVRDEYGRFCRLDGSNGNTRRRLLQEWKAYVEARRNSLDRWTSGHMPRGLSASTFLRPGRKPSGKMHDCETWLERFGPTLTFHDFLTQARGHERMSS